MESPFATFTNVNKEPVLQQMPDERPWCDVEQRSMQGGALPHSLTLRASPVTTQTSSREGGSQVWIRFGAAPS